MINSEELMLGNWVKTGNHFVTVEHIMGDEDWMEPIELTKELLEQIGFRYEDNGRYDSGWMAPQNPNNWRMKIWENDYGNFGFSINIFTSLHIKYLHELQNLFFALTKTHLKIKL